MYTFINVILYWDLLLRLDVTMSNPRTSNIPVINRTLYGTLLLVVFQPQKLKEKSSLLERSY
jgi:hypothetical protein